jgi:hypothetical protein
VAGEAGIEPTSSGLEPEAHPIDHSPKIVCSGLTFHAKTMLLCEIFRAKDETTILFGVHALVTIPAKVILTLAISNLTRRQPRSFQLIQITSESKIASRKPKNVLPIKICL